MKKVLTGLLIALITIFVIGFIVSKTSKKGANDSTAKDTTATPANTVGNDTKQPQGDWKYQNQADKMSGDSLYFAYVDATEKLAFKFPYQGGSTATLSVRKKGDKSDVFLQVSKGQFMSVSSGNVLKMKFDNEPPMNITYNEPNDGSSNVIFLDNQNEIISKLKSARHVIIEINFYDNGSRQIEFNTAGLNWAH